MIVVTKGFWWFIGNHQNKFKLDRFGINNFDDLKKIFKFNKQNWSIEIDGKTITKYGYNFFVDSKKVKKEQIIKILNKG